MRFEGIYTPFVTPCFDDYQIDESGLATVIDFLIDPQVRIWLCDLRSGRLVRSFSLVHVGVIFN